MIKNKKQFIFLTAAVFLFFGAIFPGCSGSTPVSVDGGIYKSIDGGLTWERKIQLIQPAETKVKADLSTIGFSSFVINPEDSNIVYATTPSNGLYLSKDAGENWIQFNGTGIGPGSAIFSLAIDPKNIKNMYLADIHSQGKGRVMKSEDEGATWQEVYVAMLVGEYVNKIGIDSYDSNIVYITTTTGEMFKSSDYGRHWAVTNRLAGGTITNFVIAPKDTRILYATSLSLGLFKSTNKGADWESLTPNLLKVKTYKSVINVITVDPVDPNTIYIASASGILKSTDGGVNWSSFNLITPSAILPMNSLVISKTDSKNMYYTVGSQVYFTTTGVESSNWMVRNLPTSRVLTGLTIDPKDSKIIYVGTLTPPVPKKKMF